MAEITDTAQKVLEKRYFLEGESKWEDVADRVAKCFATNRDERKCFTSMLYELDFLPNSPTLMNAGTGITSYSACFVLPMEDNIESIFKYYSDAGLISKSGGGVGANYSNIRAAGSVVGSTGGVASGPISFMKGQDALTEVIKQGGRRRGANMGILDCDHPDVMEFVKAKDTPGVLENFNLSVRVTDEFMDNVTSGYTDAQSDYPLYPEEERLWDEMMTRAHSSGEPGIMFGDAVEGGNTVPHLGELRSFNPCGEQPLLPYESCNLGSINLSNHVGFRAYDKKLDIIWHKLKKTVRDSVLFLNRVLDKSEFPVPECQEVMEKTRKIGLGIMGLHDMLIQLGLPYDSEEGREVAGKVMKFISEEAELMSFELGETDGLYGGCRAKMTPSVKEGIVYDLEVFGDGEPIRRNANLTTIAPTGTLSMIADCSSGCEPYYAPVTKKTVLDGTEFVMVNKWFLEAVTEYMERVGGDVDMALANVSKRGIMNPEVPGSIQKLFKGAEDIHWKDHIKMQAVLQNHIDSSISKTINMPHDATVEDVKEAYELAWKLGCKGVTIYRDGSRDTQILSKDSGVAPEGRTGDTTTNTGKDAQSDKEVGTNSDHTTKLYTPDTNKYPTDSGEENKTRGTCSGGSTQQPEQSPVGTGEEGRDLGVCPDSIPTPWKLDLPDELDARRYRIRDNNGDKIYVTVGHFDEEPVEMFIKHPLELPNGYLSTISRLTTLCLRYSIPLDDVTKALRKGSTSVADTPAKLARILDKYRPKSEPEQVFSKSSAGIGTLDLESTQDISNWCPDCGGNLIPGGDPQRNAEKVSGPCRYDWPIVEEEPTAKYPQGKGVDYNQSLIRTFYEEEETPTKTFKKLNWCPECGGNLVPGGGCESCPLCGWERCQ